MRDCAGKVQLRPAIPRPSSELSEAGTGTDRQHLAGRFRKPFGMHPTTTATLVLRCGPGEQQMQAPCVEPGARPGSQAPASGDGAICNTQLDQQNGDTSTMAASRTRTDARVLRISSGRRRCDGFAQCNNAATAAWNWVRAVRECGSPRSRRTAPASRAAPTKPQLACNR